MDQTIVAEIRSRLEGLEERERIAIPLAIESGSRAWGFPSPDSDYDCRFIYVRSMDKTLTLFPVRDVIEEPLTPVFDINGWELSKALKLMLSGNAVVVEWLMSVFAYRSNSEFREAALELAGKICDRALIGKHYYHLAQAQLARLNYLEDEVSLKKTLYVLRPLTALLWLSENPTRVVAPMNFQDLLRGVDVPPNVLFKIDELLEMKSKSSELGSARVQPELKAFILDRFSSLEVWRNKPAVGLDFKAEVDMFWRHWCQKLSPENE